MPGAICLAVTFLLNRVRDLPHFSSLLSLSLSPYQLRLKLPLFSSPASFTCLRKKNINHASQERKGRERRAESLTAKTGGGRGGSSIFCGKEKVGKEGLLKLFRSGERSTVLIEDSRTRPERKCQENICGKKSLFFKALPLLIREQRVGSTKKE